MHRSSSTASRDGRLSTPYAPRTSMATRHTDYPRSLRRQVSRRSPYYSLSDPHLSTYFRNKLNRATSPTQPQDESKHTGTSHRPHPLPTACYQVSVKTGGGGGGGGGERGGRVGTSARVYVTLWGSGGKLGKKRLVRGREKVFTFAPGSLETFRLRGQHLGDLTKLTVEHNGLKQEDAWLLDHITVTEVRGGRGGGGGEGIERGGRRKWHFPCKQWLSLHHSDCQLSRTLKAHPVHPRDGEGEKEVEYSVEVHTGDVRGGGTDANIFLTLRGSNGCSPKTHLKGCSFDRGSVEVASLLCRDLGLLSRVTVEQDGSGFAPDWFLEKIVVYKTSLPNKKLVFPCSQWLSRQQGDGATQRVLRPSHTPTLTQREEKTYIISTKTGSMRGAGTDANVFISLFGSEGSSGERRLDNDVANFERGRRDRFQIRCVDVGRVEKVKVRHDNSGPGPGWFLEWVEVGGEKGVWHFSCGRWLDVEEGDGVLECELTLREEEKEEEKEDEGKKEGYPYTLHITTGDRPGAATNANVHVVLHGREGESGRVWAESGRRSLLAGQTDRFEVRSPRLVSPLEQVTVGHDNSGVGPGWFLEQILVECGTTGGKWLFPCQRWLCLDAGDGRIERELHPTVEEKEGGGGERRWRVHVWTSDIRGAGTDATVTLQVHGEHCSSSSLPLGTTTDNFEQGEEDVFTISLPSDMGPIMAITVAHDNTQPYPDWHLDRIRMESECGREKYTFPCGRWLAVDKGDGQTRVRINALPQHAGKPPSHLSPSSHLPLPSLTVSSADDSTVNGRTKTLASSEPEGVDGGSVYESDEFESDSADLSVSSVTTPESNTQQTRIQELDSTITNEYIRQLKYAQLSSIDSSQARTPSPHLLSSLHSPSKEQSAAELDSSVNTSAPPPSVPSASRLVAYEVKVSTADKKHASTSNNLHLVVVGKKGTSREFVIKNSSQDPMLQRGQTDCFQIAVPPIGDLTAVRVAHCPPDDSSDSKDKDSTQWYLFQVVLTQLTDKTRCYFLCRQWINASFKDNISYTEVPLLKVER